MEYSQSFWIKFVKSLVEEIINQDQENNECPNRELIRGTEKKPI